MQFPKNSYRIRETRYPDGSGNFVVEIKQWWSPFWIDLKVPELVYLFCEVEYSDYVFNSFETYDAAVALAHRHADQGWQAFYPKQTKHIYTNLGKLP